MVRTNRFHSVNALLQSTHIGAPGWGPFEAKSGGHETIFEHLFDSVNIH